MLVSEQCMIVSEQCMILSEKCILECDQCMIMFEQSMIVLSLACLMPRPDSWTHNCAVTLRWSSHYRIEDGESFEKWTINDLFCHNKIVQALVV